MKKNILSVILMTVFAITHVNANAYPGFEENKKACEGNDPKACDELGGMYDSFGISMYVNHERIPIDYYKAAEYYKKACDLGNASGCSGLVLLYIMNRIDSLPTMHKGELIQGTNFFKANKYMRKGCDLGDGGACSFLGISYSEGTGVKQNYIIANELFKMGCKLGDASGCYLLGMSYKDGKGVRKDQKIAKKLFGMSCDLKDESGCKEYAILNK